MESIKKRIILILTLILFLFLEFSAMAANTVYKKTEFDYSPRKFVPFFFGSMNFRGRDYMTGTELFSKTLGAGGGFLYNINIDKSWRGHKFLYTYLDLEVQQEMNSLSVEEPYRMVFAMNPGLLVRTFIPYIKIFYGTGLSLRFGKSDFEQWGIYGQAGLEAWGFFFSARMVGSPGEAIIHNELRFGYMHVPSKKNFRR